MTDRVLVIPTEILKSVHFDEGVTLNVKEVLSLIFASPSCYFINRDFAERSHEHKQVIPYVVLCSGSTVCTYVRGPRSTERRLKGARSIGFGGHISPSDRNPHEPGIKWYHNAIARELNEEVGLRAPRRELTAAVINEDLSAVGRVHLGILHIWDVLEADVRPQELEISNLAFLTLKQLSVLRSELEPWSVIALDLLKKRARRNVPAASRAYTSLFDLVAGSG
jgi:predicted NUDIX family phosphoesterase